MSSTISPAIPAGIPAQVTSTSIGKKLLMAVTGFVSFGYVVGHMAGNLQIFIGQNQINAYAEALHSMGALLWVVRLCLLVFFVTHIWLGIQLKLENRSSRPESYRFKDTVQATLSSRTMIWTGLAVFTFFVYHILHYTARVTNPQYLELVDAQGRFDAYSMIIMGFQNPLISIVYIIAMTLVAFHLSHGIESMFQSMGWNSPRYHGKLKALAILVSVVIFLGFISIPVAVMAGCITLPGGGI
ncbi:MAG: succinate dehydrogenase cytochrome b subunit [Candidatus Zixiibacteriota bacterium]|nr:MAG: succinate dehydrogenase cytochrome b subunit [candidate division Zixibacteria bacterium]